MNISRQADIHGKFLLERPLVVCVSVGVDVLSEKHEKELKWPCPSLTRYISKQPHKKPLNWLLSCSPCFPPLLLPLKKNVPVGKNVSYVF